MHKDYGVAWLEKGTRDGRRDKSARATSLGKCIRGRDEKYNMENVRIDAKISNHWMESIHVVTGTCPVHSGRNPCIKYMHMLHAPQIHLVNLQYLLKNPPGETFEIYTFIANFRHSTTLLDTISAYTLDITKSI
jgi:hypothetical protein